MCHSLENLRIIGDMRPEEIWAFNLRFYLVNYELKGVRQQGGGGRR